MLPKLCRRRSISFGWQASAILQEWRQPAAGASLLGFIFAKTCRRVATAVAYSGSFFLSIDGHSLVAIRPLQQPHTLKEFESLCKLQH